MNDCIIIGKGPAGISCAIYLKRAGLDVLVIGKDTGALAKSEKIENYYGLEVPLSGKELVEKGIRQAENLGVDVITDEVTEIEKENNFYITTPHEKYESKTLLLATGKSRVSLNIKGFNEFKGKGISFCAVCDGFFYRKKQLAVIGNGEYAINEIKHLLNFTDKITLFTNGKELTKSDLPEGISINQDKITEIKGDVKVSSIVTENGEYNVDGIFVAIGTASAIDFAAKLGIFTDKDTIIINKDYMTNVEGLFAAGDATGGFLQIAKAVADGANASLGIIKYIKSKILEE